jgi:GNAT superfamily N-acetyltransferase
MPSTELNLSSLPKYNSPTLALVPATPAEKEAVWHLNGVAWRGSLSPEQYLRREHHLGNQLLTLKGGIIYWILIDTAESKPTLTNGTSSAHSLPATTSTIRTVLASCETLRKRAVVATPSPSGPIITESISHGIGSVFCREAFRGRGYARRMMQELGKNLQTWQQPEGQKAHFTVLYSDIGREFYAREGWKPFESRHLRLPPVGDEGMVHVNGGGEVVSSPLFKDGLKDLCVIDEKLLRERFGRFKKEDKKIRVAQIPDVDTMHWHHAREEFLCQEVFGKWPDVKGAMVVAGEGKRVWAIWTRTFGASTEGNVLHILRLVVEGEEEGDQGWNVKAVAAVLRAAQREAGKWERKSVEIWNPSALIVKAARVIEPDAVLVERESESITSLMWYEENDSGETPATNEIDWVGNEKYAWC